MSVFDTALVTLLNDPNLGIDIVYRPAIGAPVACRASFAQPDIELALQPTSKLRDRKRLLLVRVADVPTPAKGDMVEAPAGSAAVRVMDFKTSPEDALRITWRIELGS